MNTYLNLTALGLAAMMGITSLTACSQKPSSEEINAQVKIAMEQAEKDKQTAAAQAAQTALSAAAPVEAPAQQPVKKEAATKQAAVKHKPSVQEHERAMLPDERTKPVCANCGVVLAVNIIEEEGKGSGVGVVAGGVAGGLIGNQVGQGTGRDLATVAGVVGGAFAGNKIEKMAKKTKSYDITVKLDDGSERTYRQATDPGLFKGQKVKIENDVVVKN
ncbi:MAG: glycine zipper 2TM domain-containing protein [Gallionella sp.]|nr:glycine zipper 2TM domain-containing protein [Gallionella sp.]